MVGIIFIGDLYVCPYLHRYTDVCDINKVKYEVLFWNRCGEVLNLPKNYLYFDMQSKEEQNFVTKSMDFLKYRGWLKRIIKQRKYKKLIILSTLSGIILFDLISKYKYRYIFDIRDYSYEHLRPFYKIEQKIIKNSYYTAISSPGFKNFLPQNEYFIIHNMQREEMEDEHFRRFQKKRYGDILNIVWNGTMRYFEHQKKIIDNLANDSRFMMYYHGTGPQLDKYERYVFENGIKNIFFTGKYDNSEKSKLLKDADILNNTYWVDENENEVLYALSNRYYDGLIYRIPQLVEFGTYKSLLCETNGIGIGIAPNTENFADKLYEWYFNINQQVFEENCQKLLSGAINDERKMSKKLTAFLMEEQNDNFE